MIIPIKWFKGERPEHGMSLQTGSLVCTGLDSGSG